MVFVTFALSPTYSSMSRISMLFVTFALMSNISTMLVTFALSPACSSTRLATSRHTSTAKTGKPSKRGRLPEVQKSQMPNA